MTFKQMMEKANENNINAVERFKKLSDVNK